MNEYDIARQLITDFTQYLCDTEQGGGVNVVAAGMHDARDAGFVRNLFFILDRKGVKVGPQSNRFPRFAAPEQPDDPHAANAGTYLDAE